MSSLAFPSLRQMMLKLILKVIIFSAFPLLSYAATGHGMAAPASGFGGVASNLMVPVEVVAEFVHSACMILGGSFIIAGIVRHVEHRKSPTMSPISTVFFLFLAGGVLLALPYLSYFMPHGVLYKRFL